MGLSASIRDDDWVAVRRAIQHLELVLNKVQSPVYTGLTIDTLSGVLKATAGVVSGNATHNILASLQGGTTNEYYHLTSAAYATLSSGVSVSDTSSLDLTFSGGQISGAVLPAGVAHDSLSGYVADKHIAHSDISISAGTGLTGGGTIAANRTLALSFLGIESLADPNAHRLMGWDDTDGAIKFITVGTNLTYTQATHTLSASGGVTTLAALTDVNIPAPANSEVLTYNTATSKWVSAAGGGGGAPTNVQYVVLVADATLTDERVLTGTANQVVVTDSGAGLAVTLSTPQNIHTAATPTFAGLALGVGNLTMTGSLAVTGSRVTKGWFTDLEVTNSPTINGTAISTTYAPLVSPSFTTPTLGVALATSISIDGHVLDSGEWHYLDGQNQAVLTTSSPTFVNLQLTQHAYFDAEVDNGNSGATKTINWTLGNKQKITLTADCTFTLTAPSGPCNVILKIIQNATGGWIITWPATVQTPTPAYSTTANSTSVIAFYFDGTNYWGAGLSYGTDYSNIIMADGGTIGQAAGPLLTFDDTLNYLEITGCNVGIGTTTPNNKLHILKTSGDLDTQSISVGEAGAGRKEIIFTYNFTDDVGEICAVDQGTAFKNLILESGGGSVGIGTKTPGAKLDIASSGNIRIGFDYTGTNSLLKTFTTSHAAGNVPSQFNIGMYDGADAGMQIKNVRDGSYNSQSLEFLTGHGGISAGTRLTIDKDGNATFSGTLTVNGNQTGATDHVFDDYNDIELLQNWRDGKKLPFEVGDMLNRDRLLRDTIIQLEKRIKVLEN